MNLYMWSIVNKSRFDNPLNPSHFKSGGGYVLSKNTEEAEKKLSKHIDTGFGWFEFVDMKITFDDLEFLLNSEDKLSWNFFYGD